MAASDRVYVSRFSSEDEDTARRLVNALQVVGLDPQLTAPDAPAGRWAVEAPAELEPTPDNLAELEAVMRAVARRSGATYEGREAL